MLPLGASLPGGASVTKGLDHAINYTRYTTGIIAVMCSAVHISIWACEVYTYMECYTDGEAANSKKNIHKAYRHLHARVSHTPVYMTMYKHIHTRIHIRTHTWTLKHMQALTTPDHA